MRIITLLATVLLGALFLTSCTNDRPQRTAVNAVMAGDYWAKDNLDLQYVGDLLERADSPEEFEAYLNEDDGINNLDLNGDGYVDYISVDEFEDRGDYERGLSLYCRYGPDIIQEVGTIVFYRDDLNYPGARVLLTGNEHIYGDDYYYETNWLDRSVQLVTFLFSPRDEYYRSPYYYLNYPPDYAVYEVVETPVYRTRIERIDPQPVFVYTSAPTFINRVNIDSPYQGRHIEKVYARLAKPTREQVEFIRNNPRQPRVASPDREAKRGRGGDKPARPEFARPDVQPGEVRERDTERGNSPKAARIDRSNFGSPRPAKVERQNVNPSRAFRDERPRVSSPRADRPASARFERQRVERQRPARFEQPRMNPSRQVRMEQPRMNPSRPSRVEQPRMNSSNPARVEQPKMHAPRQANPGNSGGKGGGRGKKP